MNVSQWFLAFFCWMQLSIPFLNLLNKNWGVRQTNYTANSNQVQFLTVTQKPTAANNYTLQYRMDTKAIEPYKDYVSSSSRWAMMFGIKYKFN